MNVRPRRAAVGFRAKSLRVSSRCACSLRAFVLTACMLVAGHERAWAQTPPLASRDANTILPFIRGFATTSDVTMRIYAPAGRLKLNVWPRDSVMVRGTTGKSATIFGGGSRTHVKLGVEAKTAGDTKLPEVNWEVTVPKNARIWIKMIDGTLDAVGTSGELEMYTVRGAISARDVAGVTIIESIDAPVTVQRARGDVRVRGSGGAVIMDDIQGTSSIATVGGSVTLTRFVADGRVETIGGDVMFTGGSLNGSQLELQTHSGAITLSLDAKRAPLLELSSRAGPPLGDAIVGNAKFGVLSARSFKGRITRRLMASTPK